MAILAVELYSLTLKQKHLLTDVSITVQEGSIIALLGPNGAGKTTFLRSIMGLQQNTKPTATTNRIIFQNKVINTWPIHDRVAAGLLYLPQNLSLFRQLSVSDNLDIVFHHHHYWKNKPLELFQQEKTQLLDQMLLSHTINQEVEKLSGGQKRKLEIARALLMHSSCLLLDEPFAGVDPKSINELTIIFAGLQKQGLTILISDHHVDQLLSLANLGYVIMNGHVIAHGTPDAILSDQKTKESYLGLNFYHERINTLK